MIKYKVLWVCHFTNSQIQDRLKPLKRINQMAPWISLGIEEAKINKNIELHIISPHRWISGIKEFKDENIFYHFFNPGIPFYGRHWPGFFRFDIWTNYSRNRKIIKKLAEIINPDIVHLHGLENAYYSSSILDLAKLYPAIATVQGFISLQIPKVKISKDTKSKVYFEKEIMKNLQYFGVRDDAMRELISNHNAKASFFNHEYFTNIPEYISEYRPDYYLYDLAFFARVTKEKGIEDLIKVVAKLKALKPDIRVAVMGGAEPSYLKFLNNMAENLGCLNNFDFLGFQNNQQDIYDKLCKTNIAILPTYNDNVPGLVIESMMRHVPVVTYKTGGIPQINDKEHNIEIVDQGDIEGLVSKTLFLLDNPAYAKELAKRAYSYVSGRWNNTKVLDDMIKAYKSILKK